MAAGSLGSRKNVEIFIGVRSRPGRPKIPAYYIPDHLPRATGQHPINPSMANENSQSIDHGCKISGLKNDLNI